MTQRRTVSHPLALAVLAWLVAEPMHPYELGRRLKESGKDRAIRYNRGSLYMVVEQLRRAGFIAEQGTSRQGQRPERTVYALTDAGRAELYDWMRDLLARPQREYPHFGVALSLLTVMPPGEAADLLERRLAVLAEQAEEIRALKRRATEEGLAWVFLVEEDYRLALLEAEHRFVTTLVQALRQPGYERQWRALFPQGR